MGPAILRSMIRPGRHLLPSIAVVWWLAVPASAQALFPTDGLEDRIDFWKQVFTKYGADDVIVHDRFHVNLIYAIADEDSAERTMRHVKDSLLGGSTSSYRPDTRCCSPSGVRKAML